MYYPFVRPTTIVNRVLFGYVLCAFDLRALYRVRRTGYLALFVHRGLEPVTWHPSTDFTVTSEGGSVFEEVDLTDEGEWSDYCEKSSAPVSIMELEHKFESA